MRLHPVYWLMRAWLFARNYPLVVAGRAVYWLMLHTPAKLRCYRAYDPRLKVVITHETRWMKCLWAVALWTQRSQTR